MGQAVGTRTGKSNYQNNQDSIIPFVKDNELLAAAAKAQAIKLSWLVSRTPVGHEEDACWARSSGFSLNVLFVCASLGHLEELMTVYNAWHETRWWEDRLAPSECKWNQWDPGTPLACAVNEGHVQVARFLMEKCGQRPESWCTLDGKKVTALHLCVQKQLLELIDPILQSVDILAELQRLNEYFMTTYKLTLEIRIGVHSGEVQAGNVGSSHRLNYTVLGNTVNLASRLEAVNKEVGTQVLASNSFRSCAGGDFAFRALGSISVRGFQDLVLVHQFLGAMDRLDPTTKQLLKDYLEIDKALCEGQSNIDPMIASFLEVHPEDKTFLALACGATASGRGPVSLLSNAFEVLAYEIGRKWVVSCSRRWGFGVGEGHSKDEIPCGDCCLVVFFGVSHTLGLVWHKLHLFGGCNFGASKPCANGMQIGCYLGSSKWMSYLPWAVDRDGAFVMNEDDGRIVGRIRGSVSTLNWVESFHSNGKWLVQICRKSKMRVWRLREGVPEGHCVLIRNRPDHRIFGTRFLPWGDENEVVVVSQSKEKHASDLLFVDLQTSVFNEALVVTSSISVPYEADDILCLSRQEFLVLSRDFSIEMGFRRFTYNTSTRRLFYFPGDVQFVPPSHVLNRPRLDHDIRIYAASDLGQPLRQFQQHGCQHSFFRMTTTDRWIANGDPSVSLNVYDLVTGTTVFTLTRTLKSPGVAAQHSGETIPQHHSPRPRSPPWLHF
ncbi:hypothetical protein Pelo_3766 [Pelomyxa schiedti]|nr:hypothetical protein Pelo_3766 [Pelomyxa schiedti]